MISIWNRTKNVCIINRYIISKIIAVQAKIRTEFMILRKARFKNCNANEKKAGS